MEGKCKKHSSHKQSKGVCAYCLREKLEQLAASSASSTTNRSPSMASSAAHSSINGSNSYSDESPRQKHRSMKAFLYLLKGGKEEETLRRSSSKKFPTGEVKEKKRNKRSDMFLAMFMLAGEGIRRALSFKDRQGEVFFQVGFLQLEEE